MENKGEVKKEEQAIQKPSYEELKNYCSQLLMQRNQVAEDLNRITSIVNKLPWLFEVVKAESAFDPKFVRQCIEEIETILTPPKEEQEEDNK